MAPPPCKGCGVRGASAAIFNAQALRSRAPPASAGGSIYIQGRGRGAAMIDKKADPLSQAWGAQITIAEPTYRLGAYLQMIGALEV